MLQLKQKLNEAEYTIADLEERNAQLEYNWKKDQLKLDSCKRFARQNEKDLKARRDLNELLGREQEVSMIDRQLDQKYYEQLVNALENKELQVSKLEKLVKQMEKQEEYSQAQRTRLESRIAKLELQLKEGQHQNRLVYL